MSEFDAKAFLATLPDQPGVYRMLDAAAQVLYVGKAKSLKKRVSSYFQKTLASPRIALMVSQIASIETTVTRSEAEALLLENNLIKRLDPRFNIVFRDDKSYPYILLTRQEVPRLGFFRGTPDRRADYFGPYPSAAAVRASLHLLQKMFRLRTCEDSVFANRSRPCLLHQIRRCSAPCVGAVDPAQYADDVRMARLFLAGRGIEVSERLSAKMETAAQQLAFEQAALYRDQIQALRRVQERQYVAGFGGDEVDIVVVVGEQGRFCVNLAMIRGGEHLGDKPMFPEHAEAALPAEVLADFLGQHYLAHPLPKRIVVNCELPEEVRDDLQLGAHTLALPRADAQRAWVAMAEENARLAIQARIGAAFAQNRRLEALRDVLDLPDIPERIECFDISHTQGEAPVAACVVYHGAGMRRSEYRRFNIRDITPGDDYAAIAQAVSRRYGKLAAGEATRPDLVLIDGGIGQVRAAAAVALAEIGIVDLPLVGVAKGAARTPGREELIFADARNGLELGGEHPALQLIQEIRDEAHRFAVFGHRARREKARRASVLEEIPGVGAVRRRALINHFGGLQGVREATVEQLAGVPGISRTLAETLFRILHS